MKRSDARHAILKAASKYRRKRTIKDAPRIHGYVFLPPPFFMRHLQRAVAVCRAHRLVKDDVLVAAGFRPVGKRRRRKAAA